MKRIIALLMAVAIIGSSLIFCYANSDVKLETRLQFDSQGNASVIFSIPKNSNLKELNLDLSYFYLAMVVDSNTEVSFKSNLSPEEEAKMEWNVVTDRNKLMEYEKESYSHCFIDAYYNGEGGLVKGGDLFTLNFKLHDCVYNDTFDFKFKFNYLAANDNTDFIVPETLSYDIVNKNITSFSAEYNEYTLPQTEMQLIGDQSKMANNNDKYTDNSSNDGSSFYKNPSTNLNMPVANYMAGATGGIGPWGAIFAQSFKPANDYIHGVLLNLHIDNDPANTNVTGGEALFCIQLTDDYKNNSPQTVIGSKHWSSREVYGGSTVFGFQLGNDDVACLDPTKTHYIRFGYASPTRMRNTYVSLYNATTSYPMITSGNGNNQVWTTQTNKRMYFEIVYNQEIIDFITYVKNNCGGTPDYNTATKNIIDNATAYYNKISAAKKTIINSYSGATTYLNNYNNYKNKYSQYEGYIAEFKNKVNAIGTVTANSSSAITAAENYYNSYITTSGMKSAVSSQKATLESKRRIYDTIKAINDIGTVKLDVSYAAINNAQNKYNALINDTERNAVTNYSTLVAAHQTYARLYDQSQADKVIALINAIGTVTNPGSYNAINAAQSAYNNLTPAQQALVTNYSTLQAAHQTYADIGKANTVIATINSIGTVTYTSASKKKIDDARAAYNALTTAQRKHVSNLSTLTSAETKYNNMDNAKTTLANKVSALGTLKYTHEYQVRLAEARAALNTVINFNDSNLNTATSANKKTVEECEAKIQQMQQNVQSVINKIDAIGTVTFTTACADKITAAQNAYNALGTAEEKAAVSNYNTLQAAHVSYAILSMENPVTWNSEARVAQVLAAFNALNSTQKALVPSNVQQILTNANTRITNMKTARTNYINAVNALPSSSSVDYTTDHANKISAADTAYSAITAFNDTALTNSVSSYRTTHTNVKNNYNTIKGKVDALVTLINEIKGYMGSSAILDIASKIDQANKDFAALTTGGQNWIINNGYKKILEDANVEYLARAEAARFDIEVGKLSNPVKWNERNTVSSLRTTYSNMSASVQQYVTKLSVLSAAETRIKNMSNAVDKVVKETNEIAPVVYTNACEVRIKEARNALDAVTAYNDAGLNSAVSSQKATIEAAETKILTMRANVNNVINLINAIGTVKYPDSFNTIKAAEDAYQALKTPEEKAAVTNYDKLLASHVMYAIVKIGTVTWSDKADVETARAAYNSLNSTQKGYIASSYTTTLSNAEKEIARLQGLINTFVAAVNNIPTDDKLTINDVAKIQAARTAYNAIVNTKDNDLINDPTVVSCYNKLISSEVRNVELLIDYIFASINIDEDDLSPGADIVMERYDAKRQRYAKAVDAYNALTDSQKQSVRNAYKLDMAKYEFNVDDNFIDLYEKAGIDGKKLNHQDTDARIMLENAKIAVNAFNSEYDKAPYNYTYSYMIISAENLKVIENKVKIIEGFDLCTEAWVENGRNTDPSDFNKDNDEYINSTLGQNVRNDPVTSDSQTSIYFNVQPDFLKASSSNEKVIVGFNDAKDFERCSVDNVFFEETKIAHEQTTSAEGAGCVKMNMGAPLKEIPISETETAKAGGQFYYTFDTPMDFTTYNSFKFSIYTPVALQGRGGQLRVNFITDAGGSDGFNFVVDICFAYTGWNTYTIYNRLNPTDTVAGADWTKIRKVNFTWFNLDRIVPKDGSGNCFFLIDNLCGLTTNWVDDTVTFDNGVKTAVYFHDNAIPVNTKITLVELVNSTSKRYYGFKTTSVTSEIFLDDFVLLESKNTKYSSLNPYATAKSMTGVIKDGMSFIMILDFSETTQPNITSSTQYGRFTGISINIYDRGEYENENTRGRSTIYSITRTYIKTGTRRELGITANDTSKTTITKAGSITFSGTYSVGDVGTVNYTFNGVPDNGHKALDTFSQNKTISIMAKIKDSKRNYVPVNEFGGDPTNISGTGFKYVGKGNDCFYFTAGDANVAVQNRSFSFTISFSKTKLITSGTYTLELTISRVSNSNGALGYVNNVIDPGAKTATTTFNITDVPQAGLNVSFTSLNGKSDTKFIDTTKNNTLSLNIKHLNAKNYTLAITIQKKNTDGTYSNLDSSTYMTATTSRTLSTNDNTTIGESITLKGTQFSKGSTYRLVFTMSSGNIKIVRYLNLLTTP